MIPSFASLRGAIGALFGEDVQILERRPVYGGDINQCRRLDLSNGVAVFMKANLRANLPFFRAEARGLEALGETGTIGVPHPLAMGTDGGSSFLLMEYLESAPRIDRYWETFGRELAAMHRTNCGFGAFGFDADNYIGATPQINAPRNSWIEFFRDCRLVPQFQWADGYFDSGMRRQAGKLLDHLDTLLTEPEFPSLLHGDLWSGNAVCGPNGRAWIVDPAAYVGHFEAELAMTELFGGYPASFYDAYREINPTDSDYKYRKDLYNLYHLLNHLNLFGAGYLRSVRAILTQYA